MPYTYPTGIGQKLALGAPIVLTANLQLSLTVSLTNGAITPTLDSGDSPFLFVPAGRYRLPEFTLLVEDTLKQWLKNAADADAQVSIPTKDDVTLKLTFDPLYGFNTSLFKLTLAPNNFLVGGIPATSITALTIPTNHAWGNIFGLAVETVSVSGTVDGTGRAIQGTFQPRSFCQIPGSYRAPGKGRYLSSRVAHPTAGGKVHQYVTGSGYNEFPFVVLDRMPNLAGPPLHVGSAKSVNADRKTISVSNPTINNTSFSDLYIRRHYLDNFCYLQSGGIAGWFARARITYNASPTDHTLEWVDKAPTGYTLPAAGEPIDRISEVWAIRLEAERTGQLLFYEINQDTGAQLWTTSVYTLTGSGETRETADRRSNEIDLYSIDFGSLIENRTPELYTL